MVIVPEHTATRASVYVPERVPFKGTELTTVWTPPLASDIAFHDILISKTRSRGAITYLSTYNGVFKVRVFLLKDLDNLFGISVPSDQLTFIVAFKVSDYQPPPHLLLPCLYPLRILQVTLLVQDQGLAPQDKTSFAFL